jgi:tetratricopeptide (TPR) repeat protein
MTKLKGCRGAGPLALILGLAAMAWAQTAGEWMQKGDAEWLLRSAGDKHARQAIDFYRQAGAADAKNAEAFAAMARGYYFLGRFAPTAQKETIYQQGMEAATLGFAADPGHTGSHYWYSACLAKSLEDKSVMTKMRYKNDLESHLKKAAAMNPAYYFGGPDRAMGMILYKSPVASNQEAIKLLRKSLTYAPDYSLTLVSLAEVLIAEKQYGEAKQLCDKVAALKPKPGFERELADDQVLAKKLLAGIPK